MNETITTHVINLMRERECLRITRAEVADVLWLNTWDLDALLKIEGVTFLELIQRERLRRAEELFGKVPQRELAYALGFAGREWYKSLYEWRRRYGLHQYARVYRTRQDVAQRSA